MLLPAEGWIPEGDGQTHILSPPYRESHLFGHSLAPSVLCPGAVVVDQTDNALVALARLTAHIQRRPWLIPCIAMAPNQGPLEPLLFLVSELRDRLAVVQVTPPMTYLERTEIVAAVRRRRPPDAQALSGWVAYRLKTRELSTALTAQFRQALGGPPASSHASAATFSRLFARFGRLTARDWRAIARLAVDRAWNGDASAGHLSFRILVQYLKKYVRPSARTVSDRVGWEWVLETALRCAGYVSV